MLPTLCGQCALERGLAEGELGDCAPVNTVEGARVGCFPDLCAALASAPLTTSSLSSLRSCLTRSGRID
jgi:hypothetical protein